ncbi:hypothetical protein IJ076_03130 [Candidatus Saccharibacteria bacterium]|nr:hypothetical protein [Candidatus Saccharibacteria bacterium]
MAVNLEKDMSRSSEQMGATAPVTNHSPLVTMSAKDYIDSFSPDDFKLVATLKDNPDFYLFLAEPHEDNIKAASLAIACNKVGISDFFTSSPRALHHLVVAINNRINSNA